MTLAPIDHATDAATRPEQAPALQTPALADYAGRRTPDMLRDLLCRVLPGRIALVSSFGIERAVLHLLSRIDRAAPVIFLQTGKLFPETLRHRDVLADRLGLSDVRSVRPDAGTLSTPALSTAPRPRAATQ